MTTLPTVGHSTRELSHTDCFTSSEEAKSSFAVFAVLINAPTPFHPSGQPTGQKKTPQRTKHVREHICVGLIHTVSFTKPFSFFLPTCQTHMPYSGCHAQMNTSYSCGSSCRHLFKWKSQWNEMVIKKKGDCREKREVHRSVISGLAPQIYQTTTQVTRKASSWTGTTFKVLDGKDIDRVLRLDFFLHYCLVANQSKIQPN